MMTCYEGCKCVRKEKEGEETEYGTVSIWADEDDGMMGREIEMDAGDLLITLVRYLPYCLLFSLH